MKMKTVDVAKSAAALQDSLAKESPTHLIITRNGEPIAVLVPTPDSDLESIKLSFDPKFIEIIERSRRSVARDGGIPMEQVEAMFANDPPFEDAKTA